MVADLHTKETSEVISKRKKKKKKLERSNGPSRLRHLTSRAGPFSKQFKLTCRAWPRPQFSAFQNTTVAPVLLLPIFFFLLCLPVPDSIPSEIRLRGPLESRAPCPCLTNSIFEKLPQEAACLLRLEIA